MIIEYRTTVQRCDTRAYRGLLSVAIKSPATRPLHPKCTFATHKEKDEDMRALGIVSLGTAAILSGCSSSSSLVGRYLDADYSDGLMIVQIDRVENSRVHRTLTIGNMKSKSAAVQWTQMPITGTIHGNALNLTIENGTSNSMLNGTVVPNGLDLTMLSNGRAVRYMFKREDNAEAGKDV